MKVNTKDFSKNVSDEETKAKVLSGKAKARNRNTKVKNNKIKQAKLQKLKSIIKKEPEGSDDDLPLSVRLNNLICCPQMKESSIRNLQELLEFKEFDESKLNLNKCVSQMLNDNDQHILFLSIYRKAIVHSLLERRWDNLVELLMMLVDNFYSWIFTNFLREICEIIHHLDPRVADTELGDQLDLIKRVYETKRDVNNIV